MIVYNVEYEATLRCISPTPGLVTVKYVGEQRFSTSEPVEQADFEHYVNWKLIRKKIAGVRHLKFTKFVIKEIINA